jgi:putative selenium metabolism hydrolase
MRDNRRQLERQKTMTDALASAILACARRYSPAMVRLLEDLIAIPSESGHEKGVIDRIAREMHRLRAFDEIRVDGLGSLIGRIGRGPRVLAIDAHVDTVGVGDRSTWKHDPYKARVARGAVWGRGAGDQEGAIPSMVYAARIIRDLKLPTDAFSLYMTFTVMEEDCDGLCWQYLIREEGLRPECVVITDSTNCRILRGQRGRMEIGVWTKGRSCHGSMPNQGDNAVYKIAKIINEIERLNTRLAKDDFLGPGTVTVTYVDCKTPSMCAVPDAAFIHLDRRLTTGETKTLAIKQVKDAVRRAGVEARVEVLRYAKPAYTGRAYETEKYFPTWVVPESSRPVQAALNAYEQLFGTRPSVGRWTFSTNAVAIAGMFGIPCVGFGPAAEDVAHTVNDSVPIRHLETCAAFYAAFPGAYCREGSNVGTRRGVRGT